MSVCRIQRGRTPLHMAAAHGVARAIRVLLAAGAKVDARDEVREPDLTDNFTFTHCYSVSFSRRGGPYVCECVR